MEQVSGGLTGTVWYQELYDRWINIRARNVKMSHRESRARNKELTEKKKDIDETVDEELKLLHSDIENSADNNVVYATEPGFTTITADSLQWTIISGFAKQAHRCVWHINLIMGGRQESGSLYVTGQQGQRQCFLRQYFLYTL